MRLTIIFLLKAKYLTILYKTKIHLKQVFLLTLNSYKNLERNILSIIFQTLEGYMIK